jgi:hypothetical protein
MTERPKNFINRDIYEAWLTNYKNTGGQLANVSSAKSDGLLLAPLLFYALGQDNDFFHEALRRLQEHRSWLCLKKAEDSAWNQHLDLLVKWATEIVSEFQQANCGSGQP